MMCYNGSVLLFGENKMKSIEIKHRLARAVLDSYLDNFENSMYAECIHCSKKAYSIDELIHDDCCIVLEAKVLVKEARDIQEDMYDQVTIPKKLLKKFSDLVVDVDYNNMCTQCMICGKVVFDESDESEDDVEQHEADCIWVEFTESKLSRKNKQKDVDNHI